MNIVFWILIILFIFVLWLLLSVIFKPIGWFINGLWEDAMDEMNIEKKEKEEKEE